MRLYGTRESRRMPRTICKSGEELFRAGVCARARPGGRCGMWCVRCGEGGPRAQAGDDALICLPHAPGWFRYQCLQR